MVEVHLFNRMHMGPEDIISAYVTLRKSTMNFAHFDGKTSGEIIAKIIKRKGEI